MRVFFGLIGGALLFAAASGAAMSWDGSYYLFKILDTQAPFVVHNRWIHAPLHLPVLLASHFTSDVRTPKTVLGIVYTAPPIVALAISWWVVRSGAPWLFVWAALGIGLGTLPGQFYFISEAFISIHFFWPVLLAVGARVRRPHTPVVIFCAAVVFAAHPAGAVLLGLGAGLAFAIGLRDRNERVRMWTWALGLGSLSALRFVLLVRLLSGYERQMLSPDEQWQMFKASLAGLPLASLGCAALAASLVFLSSFLRRASRREFGDTLYRVAMASLVAAGTLLAFWARDPRLWMDAMNFRSWALAASMPFVLLAALESLVRGGELAADDETNRRTEIAQVTAVFFAVVLCVQSTVWFNLTNRLRDAIRQNSNQCISTSSLEWLAKTPLRHWPTPAYAIVLQGRVPRTLILEGDGCTAARLTDTIPVTWFDSRRSGSGWFDLDALASGIEREKRRRSRDEGFYPPERVEGALIRWTGARASLAVVLPAERVTITLPVRALHPDLGRRPVVVQALWNGRVVTRTSLADHEWHELRFEVTDTARSGMLALQVDRVWQPSAHGRGPDRRYLGIQTRALRAEPAGRPPRRSVSDVQDGPLRRGFSELQRFDSWRKCPRWARRRSPTPLEWWRSG